MGKIFPEIENIKKLKVQPTDGEWYLLNYLIENLSDDIEIYFQPFLNGDMPDIILMKKDVGVTIIEVKDWDLSSYYLDEKSNWHLKNNHHIVKSPYRQVFKYKDNMFNLHINGLLEKKILDTRFYGRINAFVYFHNTTKEQIRTYFKSLLSDIENKIMECGDNNKYFLNHKIKILKQRDYYSITKESLRQLILPNKIDGLFPESIYKEFHRYLQPPAHTIEQGIDIHYTKKQIELSKSNVKYQKIKGVAGSGKTLILAKRAVNAHKRHNGKILVLTFNITLINYIHDMISNVRESFEWNIFTILNYHSFFSMMANNYDLDADNLSDYSDESFFDNVNIIKYKSIFVDEIQDYEVSWIRIIKKFFLEENGEFVVFGDEKQNIYNRKLEEDKKPNTTIPGQWNILQESFRLDTKIAQLAENFQDIFFKNKYDIDAVESSQNKQLSFDMESNIIKQIEFDNKKLNKLVSTMFDIIRENDIHPNNVCILSYNIDILRDIDSIIRRDFNEKSLTTFESNEALQFLTKNSFNKSIATLEVNNLRKVKKYSFRLNNGMIKLSTIHSFKGWEIPTLFLIIDNDFEEAIYTAITRARHNIIIFNKIDNKYYTFFNNEIDKLQ